MAWHGGRGDIDFPERTSLHVSVAGWALLLLAPGCLVCVGTLGYRLEPQTGIQLGLWMPDPIALALLSLPTGLGTYLGADTVIGCQEGHR